ncbi:EamA family transporter [Mycetocola tolaasinivorans]|uniref:EamA family transporter n=1 Tax=Mycetocola tolaasinivorans TaxID=76635 RepID=A0A3L7A8Q4_9MICO|nr:EamA family transporter [Mycetocola tolaasinivorans]RLP76557.1 EamA family transporter [Mycetocola tolaasinivorans]
MSAAGSPKARLTGVALVLAGMACQDVGAAFAILVFPQTGALGMVALRMGFSAILLFLIARPRLRGHSRSQWLTVVGFAFALMLMNTLFYLAIDRIPLGPAVAIEVLGPLTLSVITGRGRARWAWAGLALAGVALLGHGGWGTLDPIGVLLALLAGVMWALYIVTSARTGASFPGLSGLAIAMSIGAVMILPFGLIASGGAVLAPNILALGLLIAIMSSAIPYAAELNALRRLPTAVFSILMSLGPVVAALAGLFVLHQKLGLFEVLAIVLIVAASAGAVHSSRPRNNPPALDI